MLSTDTKEFIESWEIKLGEANTETLDGLYNKFTSLFTLHNRYYNEAFAIMKANKEITKERNPDYERATILIVQFLGADNIIQRIIDTNNQKNIDAVCQLLMDRVFYINLAEGQPSEENDKLLLLNLQSTDNGIKSKAVLSLIYNIRNNMLHGYKAFQEYQRMLIEPVIELLEVFVLLFKEKFK